MFRGATKRAEHSSFMVIRILRRQAPEVSSMTPWPVGAGGGGGSLEVWLLKAASLVFSTTSRGTGHGLDTRSSGWAGFSSSGEVSPGSRCH